MASTINASSTGSGGLITTGDASGQLALQANGVTQATVSSTGIAMATGQTISTANTYGFKNRLINGAMVIDQRNAGASVSASDGTFGVDRWQVYATASSKFTLQQNAGSVTPPVGFSYYQGCTSSAATTVASGDTYAIAQKIEGYNFADLGWGTANAKTVTLSAWVYSSLTGTFGGALSNSALTRSYPFTFTISSANTWTQISITVAGDTSGTWIGATNGIGCRVIFNLGTGSTYSGTAGAWASSDYRTATSTVQVVATNGATFYFTGVQLEVGSQATSFDFRSYGTELALCQRYLPILGGANSGAYYCMGYAQGSTMANLLYTFKVTPRVPPTGITIVSPSSLGATTQASGGNGSSGGFTNATLEACNFFLNTPTASYTVGYPLFLYSNGTAGQVQFTGCEL